MKSYELELRPAVRRFLKKLSRPDRARIGRRIDSLRQNPRPPDAKRVQGTDYERIRSGDYRIIYQVHDDVLLVLVVRVGHRRDAYRKIMG